MIKVLIKTESHYSVNRNRIRDRVVKILYGKGVKDKAEVSISVVGDRQMKFLNKTYRNIDETTDVLSFPLSDEKSNTPFVEFPDEILRLGDIAISYPQAREDAIIEDKLMDDKIDDLIEHGLMHLLGNHHD